MTGRIYSAIFNEFSLMPQTNEEIIKEFEEELGYMLKSAHLTKEERQWFDDFLLQKLTMKDQERREAVERVIEDIPDTFSLGNHGIYPRENLLKQQLRSKYL